MKHVKRRPARLLVMVLALPCSADFGDFSGSSDYDYSSSDSSYDYDYDDDNYSSPFVL